MKVGSRIKKVLTHTFQNSAIGHRLKLEADGENIPKARTNFVF